MYLSNGDYIKQSEICYLSSVKKQAGERRWNTTMTKELVEPDSYYIEIKLTFHSIKLEYESKDEALAEYEKIFNAMKHP